MSTDTLPLLLEVKQLQGLLQSGSKSLLILDVSSADNYTSGHIPGALHVAPTELTCGIKPATGKLPSIEHLNNLFSRLGLDESKHVIAYDDEGGGWAGRLIWTLDVLGHTQYSYLDGGIVAWRDAALPLETKPSLPQSTTFTATLNPTPIMEIEDLMQQLGSPGLAIWDARSPEEFAGTKVLAERGGHVPGAVNYEWTDLMDHQNSLRLLPLADIKLRLKALGITPDKQVVTYCQTHHRSGLTYLAAKILGYTDIKAYHGSWSEWGNRTDTPVEVGTL